MLALGQLLGLLQVHVVQSLPHIIETQSSVIFQFQSVLHRLCNSTTTHSIVMKHKNDVSHLIDMALEQQE